MYNYNKYDIQRLYNKTYQSQNGCWIWKATTDKNDYPLFSLNNKMIRAHRLAYQEYYNDDPTGKYICHKCDNPLCINPEHLFSGDQKANMEDSANKNRTAPKKGTLNGRSKLEENDVLLIRELYDNYNYSVSSLSREFNIGWTNCNRIVKRETWKHI